MNLELTFEFKLHSFLFLTFCGILFIITAYLWPQSTDFHDFTGKCLECHLTMPTEKNKGMPLIFTKEISFLCGECHEEGEGPSHPVDVRASMTIPSVFPLDRKGNITCVTCHSIHKEDRPGNRYILRVEETGEPFCMTCHSELIEGLAMHKGTVESAHISRRYVEEDKNDIIDELSAKCLNCHDASFASDTLVEYIGRGSYRHGQPLGLSHLIGVDYYLTYSKYSGAYVAPESLRPEIKLFSGKVGCGSCHNPYSKRHFQLVMSNEKSALCYGCHRK